MAIIDLSKVMNLADAQEIYKDLRDRLLAKYEKPSTGIPASDLAAGVIPTVPVTDVRVNNTSILQNGIANVPVATYDHLGAVKISGSYGLRVFSSGEISVATAGNTQLKLGTEAYCPITPSNQHKSVFYGISKLAGVDLKDATVTVGTYPDSSKQAIQKMLGLDGLFGDYQNGNTASKAYAIGETFIMDGKRYKVTAAISDGGLITVGTNCELDPIDGRYVKFTDKAGTTPGVVRIDPNYGIGHRDAPNEDVLMVQQASGSEMKSGYGQRKPIVPSGQHMAVFYGLAKAAGDTTQASSDNAVGTYTADAITAILTMLNAVSKDTKAGSGAANLGLVFAHGNNGIGVSEYGGLYISRADSGHIKAGTNTLKPIVPEKQHEAVFYGLAKAAGADEAASARAVGNYNDTAKAAIQSMLGVSTGAILIENVSGGTPTLTCLPNVRYKCGEVSTLSITPPASGSCEVIFESGSTATLLTVPNTVKFPPWFDATSLETGTIYDIIITDGVYGAVMSWAS